MKQPKPQPVTLPQPLAGMGPVRIPIPSRLPSAAHRVELVRHPARQQFVRVVRHVPSGRFVEP